MYENALNEIKKLGVCRKGIEAEISKLEKRIKLLEDKITSIEEESSYVITDTTEKNELIAYKKYMVIEDSNIVLKNGQPFPEEIETKFDKVLNTKNLITQNYNIYETDKVKETWI